jgi:hypothetical protein
VFPEITEDLAMTRRTAALGLAALAAAAALAGGPPGAGPKIEPRADKHLKAMSDYLAGLKTFSFQAEEFFDDVQDDGLKIQLSNQRRVTVRRPDRLAGETAGDTSNSSYVYDGKAITVVDRAHKTYAVEKVPDTIDAMIDDLHERFGVDRPLSDFLFADPYKVLTEHVQSGAYVGLHHVGKTKCHHLAFRQRILDWQIWIDAGERPLPRKLLITFKRQADEPQYTALLHRWDVNPKVADEAFAFEPPAGFRKVDFLQRHGEPEKKPARKGRGGP